MPRARAFTQAEVARRAHSAIKEVLRILPDVGREALSELGFRKERVEEAIGLTVTRGRNASKQERTDVQRAIGKLPDPIGIHSLLAFRSAQHPEQCVHELFVVLLLYQLECIAQDQEKPASKVAALQLAIRRCVRERKKYNSTSQHVGDMRPSRKQMAASLEMEVQRAGLSLEGSLRKLLENYASAAIPGCKASPALRNLVHALEAFFSDWQRRLTDLQHFPGGHRV
jgi:hypothetical protein